VYVHPWHLHNFKVGDIVRFSLARNSQGQLQAVDLETAPTRELEDGSFEMDMRELEGPEGRLLRQSSPEDNLADQPQNRQRGTIKYINERRGYGIMTCPVIDDDIFIHRSLTSGFKIGDTVSFKLMVSQKGQPEAKDLVREQPPPPPPDLVPKQPPPPPPRQFGTGPSAQKGTGRLWLEGMIKNTDEENRDGLASGQVPRHAPRRRPTHARGHHQEH
jgi:cold shock CspA family protein